MGRGALRRVRLLHLGLRHAGSPNEEFESRLVWVFGSPRSGSTWLLQLLARHDAVVPVNEPLIGWYLGPFLCDLPGFSAPALDSDSFTLRRVQREKPGQFFSAQFRDVWGPGLAQLMRHRFYAQASRHDSAVPVSRRVVVIKEPNGSQSADLIMSVLPAARLLFLLRDGRDVVDSELAANLAGSWVSRDFPGVCGIEEGDRHDFVVQSAYKWLWRTEVVQQAYVSHPGSKLLLRYEDILEDPAAGLREVFDWLDLAVDDASLAAWIDRHSFETVPQRGPQSFYRAASPGLWQENLTPVEQESLERIIGPKLRELGYDA